jgi:hypothetical protein
VEVGMTKQGRRGILAALTAVAVPVGVLVSTAAATPAEQGAPMMPAEQETRAVVTASAENVADTATVTVSSQSTGSPGTAAVDGVIGGWPAHPANEWASVGEREGAWIRLTWAEPQRISEIRLWDRPNARDQVTGGLLAFSDGSTAEVGVLANGVESPAVVTFAPRQVTWVEFEVTAVKATTAHVGLAEIEALTGPPPDPGCEQYTICVVGPSPGTTVDGDTVVSVYAPGMRNVAGRVWGIPAGGEPSDGTDAWFVQSSVPDADGYVELLFPADTYPHGPTTVLISAWDSPPGDPGYTRSDNYYLQLYNDGGSGWAAGATAMPPAAAGMTLTFEEDFDAPLSATATGSGAEYAALLPWDGGTEFGEAHFADPQGPLDPFTIVDDQFLRIRGSKAPADFVDPRGWNRKHIGGLLSSLRTDGTGFSARYGYFEARFLAPPGDGPWPAFWLMSNDRVTEGLTTSAAELDIVELHAESISMRRSSRAQHCWRCAPETHQNNVTSSFPYGIDSGRTWHTYAANVTPTETIYYVDDVEVWRQPTLAPAHDEKFFMIDLAMGGGWPIDLSRYGDQVDMWVDYIRVYEPSEETS